MKTAIYALFDPVNPKIARYVGRTTKIMNRIKVHFTGKEKKTRAWVKSLVDDGRLPSYRILEYVDFEKSIEAETKWINTLQNKSLLNVNQVGTLKGIRFVVSGLLPWDEVEMKYIDYILKRCRGNKLAACRVLGIGRQTLYNKLKQAES